MRQIVVVDDDLLTRTTLTILLEEAGYAVQTASDGLEALTMILAQPPDLVISDIGLPRLSGTQLLQQLRNTAHTRELPVVLTSASTNPSPHELQGSLFLEKPVGIDLLLHTVATLLAKPYSRSVGQPRNSTLLR